MRIIKTPNYDKIKLSNIDTASHYGKLVGGINWASERTMYIADDITKMTTDMKKDILELINDNNISGVEELLDYYIKHSYKISNDIKSTMQRLANYVI